MNMPRLERPVHYGNAGLAFNERVPLDDAYIFKPENTQDVWSAIRTITERYGYDFRADERGDFVLRTRNNPHVVFDLETSDMSGSTQATNPTAYAGTYLVCPNGSAGSFALSAARIDLVCPRAPGLGTLSYTVTRDSDSLVVASGTVAQAEPSAPAVGVHYYDYRSATDNSNATVKTLWSGWYDDYTVAVTASGTCWLDCLLLWHTDPLTPLLPGALATDANALSVAARSVADELRNYVIVVGRRRAVVTDSAKLSKNPENPESEFVVASGVNLAGIVTPTDPNFIGFPKESIIYDSGITDDDFAQYLARVFIYRTRNPRPSAPITHTLMPVMQLRDPVYADEAQFSTVTPSSVLWVTGITHRIEADRAVTELDTTSLPEFPSYEVREDIDVDATFNGQPVINVAITYRSLDDTAKSNLSRDGQVRVSSSLDAPAGDVVTTVGTVSGESVDMTGKPWPPVPGTMMLLPDPSGVGGPVTLEAPLQSPGDPVSVLTGFPKPSENDLAGTLQFERVIDTAFTVTVTAHSTSGTFGTLGPVSDTWDITADKQTSRQFYYEYNAVTEQMKIYRSGVGGTGTAGSGAAYSVSATYQQGPVGWLKGWLGNTPYHRFTAVDYAGRAVDLPWEQGDGSAAYQRPAFTACTLRYRAMRGDQTTFTDPYGGSCPFYDPYTSELGYLVNVDFDALLSTVYRISVRSCYDDTVVAWLTEPTADPTNDEAHWAYITAGADKSLAWDGVDQLGEWNRRQSQFYADAAHGAFDAAERPTVGSGYYAWNYEERISNGEPRRALISGQTSASRPVFGHGTYAEWYVKFECKSDQLKEAVDAGRSLFPYDDESGRVVQTSGPDPLTGRLNQTGDPNDTYEARIYTHLPEPTRCAIRIFDWVGSAPYDEAIADEPANWGAASADATINNQKPVRLWLTVQERPGVLWAGNTADLSVKLTRHVHFRRNLMDQVAKFDGVNYPGQDVESRRILNRRSTNDDHTLTFVDDGYRTADSFRQSDGDVGTEWIFKPEDFKKDFRGTPNEPLQFADYLQLDEVPFWDATRTLAGARSRLQIAFVQDLFYLSAYVQDRSGRFSWCLNTSFVDTSKILGNTAAATWPDDPNLQFRRTVFVRQWTDELVRRADTGQYVSYADWLVWQWGSSSSLLALARHKWRQHSPRQFGGWGGYADDYLTYDVANTRMPNLYSAAENAQLGKVGTGTALGSSPGWTWEGSPAFPPNVTRDFHGFYLVPPMPDKQPEDAQSTWVDNTDYGHHFIYVQVDDRVYNSGGDYPNTGDDVAAQTVWNSPIAEDTQAYGSHFKRFYIGRVVTPGAKPNTDPDPKSIQSYQLDYQRQDSLVHYEDLRGIYSRGPRPAEQPKKVQPGLPYYQNVYRYNGVTVGRAREQQGYYPLYKVEVYDWFEFTFRSEYLWESGRLFPVGEQGAERLDAANYEFAGLFPRAQFSRIRFDDGAWTGFKDDVPGVSTLRTGATSTAEQDRAPGAIGGGRVFKTPANVFTTPWLPWAVGPRLPQTVDGIFHLVLVNERRDTPL